jgi:HPt (histidine-containing phosphotransfer) domain-containing protein
MEMNKLEYQYIDLRSIKEDTLGDIEIFKMIIELFIEGIDEYLNSLNNELKHENWQALFMATHKIKPNISMFGISQLESVILQLEHNFKNEDQLETIDQLVSICLNIFKHVKAELQAELKMMQDE